MDSIWKIQESEKTIRDLGGIQTPKPILNKLQKTDENAELIVSSYLIGDKTVKNNSFKFLFF